MATNLSNEQLEELLQKRGYGIASQTKGISGGIKGTVRAGSSLSKAGGSGSLDDVEHSVGYESLAAKKLQIECRGKIRVRVTFYRRRLADYSRAISEKALVDCITKSGLIPDDSEREIWLEDGGQHKVGSDEEENTTIEIIYPDVDYDNPWIKSHRTDGR